MKIVVTGAGGLLGWHLTARLHAANCAARFRGEAAPYDIAALDRAAFQDDARLAAALHGADAIAHFAGINRADETALEDGNIALADRLSKAITGSPALVYANSTHAGRDIPYGRGKAGAAAVLARRASGACAPYVDLTLPHIFGEGGRAHYNNVTGTLCHEAVRGGTPDINPDGAVELLHAGEVADWTLRCLIERRAGADRMPGHKIAVPALWDRIRGMHDSYQAGIFPDVSDPFDCALFNTYRLHRYPDALPGPLTLHRDARGVLFEAAKGGGGGQTFLSWTEPGVTRGDHFHLSKIERFLVVEGRARIRIRRVLGDDVWTYDVNGEAPRPIDMPTLHTHSIENIGDRPLLTLFWTHEIFDPAAPDTYSDPVLKGPSC